MLQLEKLKDLDGFLRKIEQYAVQKGPQVYAIRRKLTSLTSHLRRHSLLLSLAAILVEFTI